MEVLKHVVFFLQILCGILLCLIWVKLKLSNVRENSEQYYEYCSEVGTVMIGISGASSRPKKAFKSVAPREVVGKLLTSTFLSGGQEMTATACHCLMHFINIQSVYGYSVHRHCHVSL